MVHGVADETLLGETSDEAMPRTLSFDLRVVFDTDLAMLILR